MGMTRLSDKYKNSNEIDEYKPAFVVVKAKTLLNDLKKLAITNEKLILISSARSKAGNTVWAYSYHSYCRIVCMVESDYFWFGWGKPRPIIEE